MNKRDHTQGFRIFLAGVGLCFGLVGGVELGYAGQKSAASEPRKALLNSQKTELKAFEARQKKELKELKASQDVKHKEWKTKETEARHRYFEEHPRGSERRTYIQDFITRRDLFRRTLLEEKNHLIHEHEEQVLKLKQEQTEKLMKLSEVEKKPH